MKKFLRSRLFLTLLFTFICYVLLKTIGLNLMICAAFGMVIGEQCFVAYQKNENDFEIKTIEELQKGDLIICRKDIKNISDQILFVKGNKYEILSIESNFIILNHMLYGLEYDVYKFKFIKENFVKI